MNEKSISPAAHYLSPAETGREIEVANHLLTASGVLAIGFVAVISVLQFGFWPQLPLFIIFTVIFVGLANGSRLGLGSKTEVIGILTLCLLSVICWFTSPTNIILILTVVIMAEAPYILSRRQCWLLMFITNFSYLASVYLFWNFDDLFLSWFSMLALQAFATTSSLARVQESQLKLQLFEQNAELINARSALAQKSQMEERLRIAGDLHDSIGHQLTALRLQLEALSQIVPAEIKPKVANSQQLSRDLLDNIRDIVKRMSRDEPTDLGSLIQQIDSDTPGVAVTLVTSIPELDVALQQQLISCIKEGVSNAIRHGRADKIDIKFGDNSVWIDDNGKGVDANHATGFGLNNLKQRLAPFEGKIELGSRKPSGCRLIIRWETAIDGDLVK